MSIIKEEVSKVCARCGRNTHTEETCKNKTHKDGHYLQACARCGRDSHNENKCYAKTRTDELIKGPVKIQDVIQDTVNEIYENGKECSIM